MQREFSLEFLHYCAGESRCEMDGTWYSTLRMWLRACRRTIRIHTQEFRSFWRSIGASRLWKLSQSCGLKLVLKLHPFESRKAHTRYLRRHLRDHINEVTIVSGTVPVELWQRTHIALTVESTIALDCAARGIPVFFCAWL